MNRQVRRIEEKKERKQEEAKAKTKAQRQARRRERQEQRSRSSAKQQERGAGKAEAGQDESGGNGTGEIEAGKNGSGGNDGKSAKGSKGAPARRGSDPGRFSGALMVATMFFMALQAVTPSDGLVTTQLVAASFYLLFGYFAVLWMMRRGSERPVVTAIGLGLAVGIGTAASQWFQPNLDLAPIMLALIAPMLVAGAFLGRLVFRNAPR